MSQSPVTTSQLRGVPDVARNRNDPDARATQPSRHGRAAFGRYAVALARAWCVPFLLVNLFALMPASSGALDLDALIGFGQGAPNAARYRPDSATPLTVYFGNVSVSGDAQVQVRLQNNDHNVIFTRNASLRAGPQNEPQNFLLPLQSQNQNMFGAAQSGTDITVQLVMDGRKLAERKFSLPIAVDGLAYNVLALTRDGSGLNFLARKKLGILHRHTNPSALLAQMGNNPSTPSDAENFGLNPNVLPPANILYTDPLALPSMAQGYEMMDAIALADLPLDSLKDDQLDALKGYVRDGGLLVIAGGADLSRLGSAFFKEMLPISPNGVSSVADLPALSHRYHEDLKLLSAVTLTRGTLKPGARALFTEGGAILVATMPYGAGQVVFTAFDYLAPEFRAWKGAPSLWRDLLSSGNDAVSPRGTLAMNSRMAQEQSLVDALAGRQATNTPAFGTVAGFVAAYVFLLVPVSYFVLKKLDRREMAWFTAPALILCFSIVSYLLAAHIKGGRLTVNRAVVLETQANTDQAAGYAHMTLYSPRRAMYDISFGAPDDTNNPYRTVVPTEMFSNPGDRMGADLTVDQGKTTTLRGALIRLWDKRSFETPVVGSLGGAVKVTSRAIAPDLVSVTITNGTRFLLKDCAIADADHADAIGDLPSGATVVKQAHWSAHAAIAHAPSLPLPAGQSTNTHGVEGQLDTPEAVRERIRNDLNAAIAGGGNENMYGIAGNFGRGDTVLTGWFYDPLLEVRVDGQTTAGTEVNLLYVHLPCPQDVAPKLRKIADAFSREPLVHVQEEKPLGPRGIFQ